MPSINNFVFNMELRNTGRNQDFTKEGAGNNTSKPMTFPPMPLV